MDKLKVQSQKEWSLWTPSEKIVGTYTISSIVQNSQGLTIYLINTKQHKVEINFDTDVALYTRNPIDSHHLEASKNWSFFKIKNSSYTKWLSITSDSWSDYFNLIHFIFVDDTSIFEVICDIDPITTVLN